MTTYRIELKISVNAALPGGPKTTVGLCSTYFVESPTLFKVNFPQLWKSELSPRLSRLAQKKLNTTEYVAFTCDPQVDWKAFPITDPL